ncbi:MAG: DUF885 domain-containing protein [Casimicrobiaceae bacterium]
MASLQQVLGVELPIIQAPMAGCGRDAGLRGGAQVKRAAAFLAVFLVVEMPLARAAEPPAWVKESDENAQIALAVFARYAPEFAGQTGVAGLDEQIRDLRPGVSDRFVADAKRAAGQLRAKIPATRDPRVRQDLEILIKAQEDAVASTQLNRRLMLDYINVAQTEFVGIEALLDPQMPKERRGAALVRLRRYAGLEPGTQPLTQLAIDRTAERFDTAGLIGPYINELNKGLADTKHYIDGMRELFEKSGLAGWQEPLDILSRQLMAYDNWVRTNLLPRTRATNRLPPEIYADNLKQVGVDIAPKLLIGQAQFAFAEIQNQMRALAMQIAKQRGFKSSDYRAVLRELKKEQVVGESILPLYRKRLGEIEAIIAHERVVTLPERKGAIRLASAAETAQTAAPHMKVPRLIGNTGEYGEFVLPLNIPGAKDEATLAYDDFTSDGVSWTMISHESRPGHELQFASMVERGVSIARAIYASNSANTEGWALYAEAEMLPYEPLEGQLFALQFRLVRAARAFLDPMVNLGLTTPERVAEVLRDEVVLSPAMVKQEVDRYTFDSPGQATSYYYGYMRLMQLRAQTELTLGPKFDRLTFNDFVLSQGLLPPDLMQQAVETEFIPRF